MQRVWYRWWGGALCAALLPTLWLACTEHNPKYCTTSADCKADPQLTVCDVLLNRCVSGQADLGGGGRDMAMMVGRDMTSPPDLLPPADLTNPPDLLPPPCTRNYECFASNSVCVLSTGVCSATSSVLYVNNDANACSASGSGGKPYCQLAQAITDSNFKSGKIGVILFRASATAYNSGSSKPITFTQSVRLVGERASGTDTPVSLADAILVQPGNNNIQVSVEDLSVSNISNGAAAIACQGKSGSNNIALSVSWSQLTNNTYSAVSALQCTSTTIQNTLIYNNATDMSLTPSQSAVYINEGSVVVLNSMIVRNGNSAGEQGGGLFLNGGLKLGTITLAFDTIADNNCIRNFPCNAYSSAASTSMSYSIVTAVSTNYLNSVDAITLNDSLVPADYPSGTNNILQTAGVPVFKNPSGGDYHLTTDAANSVLRVSDPLPSVTTDIDGDRRPGANGMVDVGADQRVP